MKTDDIVQAFATMTPDEIKDVCARLARVFAEKAEAKYDADPENNGRVAQPYADISDFMAEASFAFEEPEAPSPVDAQALSANTEPRTPKLSEVTASTKKSWGGW